MKKFSSLENTPLLTHEPLSKEDIIKQVIELQKQWGHYVTEQSPEFILELYKKKILRFEVDKEGKIIATLYIQPLAQSISIDDPDQVFRIGGFAISSSLNGKEAAKKILHQLETEVLEKKWNVIGKTDSDNEELIRYLKNNGMEDLTYEECKNKYPRFLDLYLKASKKREEEYYNQKFFVKTTH
ncbi:MAG: hypothetical protein WCW93_00395 [Candidatus Paceibacterota bacterium]